MSEDVSALMFAGFAGEEGIRCRFCKEFDGD